MTTTITRTCLAWCDHHAESGDSDGQLEHASPLRYWKGPGGTHIVELLKIDGCDPGLHIETPGGGECDAYDVTPGDLLRLAAHLQALAADLELEYAQAEDERANEVFDNA
jgi:hypothetical protein